MDDLPQNPPCIEPTSPLGKALVDFFGVLGPTYADGKSGVFKAIIFGGCAVHIHTRARGSADIDAELASHGSANKDEIIAMLLEEPYEYIDEDNE